MIASPITRLRRLLRVGFAYLAGWRGFLLVLAVLLSAAIVGLSSGSVTDGVLTLVATSIPLAAVAVLLANLEGRSANRSSVIATAGPGHRAILSAGTPRTGLDGDPIAAPIPGVTGDPLVAVVITTWNESRFVRAAIESVRSQTLERFECIIVDDASTDDTVDKVLSLVGGDARFRLVTMDANQGLSSARNAGLAEVQAPYVTFLDGDDFLYPTSIQKRLERITAHASEPWIAGAYCQWTNVSESATIGTTPKSTIRRPQVSWLTSLSDAPFIASAPLIRSEIVRSVGGFPAVDTAEDALLWNRILREGYTFTPVHEIGVAYRMKRASMFRRTAVEHAGLIANEFATNGEATDLLTSWGPFPYRNSCTSYMWELTRVRRSIGALASAVEAGDDGAAATIAEQVSAMLEAYQIWSLPIDEVIKNQATRVCRYVDNPELAARRDRVAEIVSGLLEDRVQDLLSDVRDRQRELPKSFKPEVIGGSRRVEPRSRVEIPPTLLEVTESAVDGRVILMPSAAYHVEETGPISEQLAQLGIESVVMVDDRRWPSVERAQAAYDSPVLATVAAGPWLGRAAAVVVMNDWGEAYREYVDAANALGVPTFAKVEGVQDFADDDVHWDRRAYQRARWILAQGPNDVASLPEQDTIIVSNNRLERIWLGPERIPGSPVAVINLNFTYGVLTDARDMWLSSVVEACLRADLPYVISLHPAERGQYAGTHPVATVPIRHLLTEGSVLVSRFSTVPFEAMARGVPFVYHNPHGEKVPTFLSPQGAFDITTSTSALTEALRASQEWQVGYRERARVFFLNQVAVDVDVPAPRRAAEAIVTRLSRS